MDFTDSSPEYELVARPPRRVGVSTLLESLALSLSLSFCMLGGNGVGSSSSCSSSSSISGCESNDCVSDMSEMEVVGVSGSSDCDVSSSSNPPRDNVVDNTITSVSGSEKDRVRDGVETAESSEHIVRDRGEGGRWLAGIEEVVLIGRGSCVMK